MNLRDMKNFGALMFEKRIEDREIRLGKYQFKHRYGGMRKDARKVEIK